MSEKRIITVTRKESPIYPKDLLVKLTRKAEGILNDPINGKIDIHTFSIYNPAMIEDDLQHVAQITMMNKLNPPEYAVGEITEGFVYDMVLNRRWFGKNTSIRKTSEYDDVVNHIDFIIGFLDTQRNSTNITHAGMSIDTTTNFDNLEKKLSEIYRKIKNEKIGGYIKYADIDGFKGELSQLPELVLYIDPKELKKDLSLWLENSNNLDNSDLKIVLLLQILLQLKYLYDRASESRHSVYRGKIETLRSRIINEINKCKISPIQLDEIKQNSRSLDALKQKLGYLNM